MWYKQTLSTSKKKRKEKIDEPGDFWGTFHYFSTLIWHDRIRFSKCGRRAGVASTFKASHIGRFAKRSCALTTHTNYLKTTHTLPAQSRQTGFLLALTGEKKKQSRCPDVLSLAPTCISKSHWTSSPTGNMSVNNLWANIFEGEIIDNSRSTKKTVNVPGCLAVSVSFMTPFHCQPGMVIQHAQTRLMYTGSIVAAVLLNNPLGFVDPKLQDNCTVSRVC